MACIYTVKGKEYSEAEFKKYLVDNLKDLVENDKFIDLGRTKENVPGKEAEKPQVKEQEPKVEAPAEPKQENLSAKELRDKELDDKISEKKKQLKQKLGNRLGANIPLDVLPEIIDLAKLYLEKYGNKFSDFVKGFRSEHPEFKDISDDEIKEKVFDQAVGEERKSIEEKYKGDPEMTKMANAINDSFIEGEFGTKAMDNVVSQLQSTDFKDIYNQTREKIEKGIIDPEKVRKRIIEQRTGSEADQAVLLYDLAKLKEKSRALTSEIISETNADKKIELQNELINVQNDMVNNSLANRLIGRGASNIFKIRQVWADKDANLGDMIEQYKASKGKKELTKDEYDEIVATHKKLETLEGKIKELEASEIERKKQFEKLEKENETLKRLRKESLAERKKDRATTTAKVFEASNKRIADAKERLRQRKGQLNSGINPEDARDMAIIAKEQIVKGVTKFDEIVKNVLDEVKDIFPDFTEDDIKAHLAYTKESKPQSDATKIAGVLKRTLGIEAKTKAGDFEPKARKVYEPSKELRDAKEQYAIERFKWEKARRLDLLDKQPIAMKIADSIIRWQRFAILSYPTTIVKLMGVVAHGLAMKPIVHGTQMLVNKLLPKSITSKSDIWGKPSSKALADYYSEFVNNFTLKVLKEHFTGVDALESQYGKPFLYDEWNLGRGILEMPGRSHGYIKSFIKRPEFKYAQTQINESYANKMIDAQSVLKDPHSTKAEKIEAQHDFNNYDLSNPDVASRANQLALEHGKWSILMNDSKGIERLQQFLGQKSVAGYLLKTELPIVKIPLNYIGRSFAVKYGFLRAIIGKHDMFDKDGIHNKGLAEMFTKGTKDLSPEEANLLSKSLTLGSMGAGLFALGYLNHKNIKQNDDGSQNIFSKHIPRLFLHNPAFESIFNGANAGNKYEKRPDKGGYEWLKSYVESDIEMMKNNPFSNMLKYGATGKLLNVLVSKEKDNPDNAETAVKKVLYGKVSDMVSIGLLKEVAKAEDEQGVKYAPDSFLDFMKLGVPVARQTIPHKATTPLEKARERSRKALEARRHH